MATSILPVALVAFDLTGTTVKDNGAMERALQGALDRHGITYDESDIRAMRGRGKKTAFQLLVQRGLGENRGAEAVRSSAMEVYRTFKEILRAGYAEGPLEEVPGSESTIRWLKERGVKVAATTALDSDVRDQVLSRLGWREGLFDCMVSTDEVPLGRPAPYMIHLAMMRCGVTDVRRVAVVGDTPLDLLAGTNAGAAWVIGVLCGVYGLDALGCVAHTHLLASPAELPRLFEA